MSARKRCDLCPQWHTKASPVREFQIAAKVDEMNVFDGSGVEEVEYERIDLCLACVVKWIGFGKEYIGKLKAARDARDLEEAKEAGEV